ncbi:F0F1 ATP synthase subunit I [Sphaerotilus microaerophilus]|uniref:F0F1 ATP synthase subunit I n=1 Tax=Sphaerotilus microaerophilus TaxID=2914710 RepID=A0ABM7YTN8_9BURK|nr:F0F1 ATP synthase subunit I [Sphaerotilus sp. FB-5]
MHEPAPKQSAQGAWRVWDDDEDERSAAKFKSLSREEAQALREREPSISPWRVVVVQALVGVMLAVLAWWLAGRVVALSALYGSFCVVLPGALMARGLTSQFSRLNAGVAAVSFMMWEFGKIGVSVFLLVLAPKIVHGVNWLALLLALIVCIKIYWVALLWRGSKKR